MMAMVSERFFGMKMTKPNFDTFRPELLKTYIALLVLSYDMPGFHKSSHVLQLPSVLITYSINGILIPIVSNNNLFSSGKFLGSPDIHPMLPQPSLKS